MVTGILLMFYYVPSTTQAYDRMLDLRGTVASGIFLATCISQSAATPVWWPTVFLHMCRVFLTGSYKASHANSTGYLGVLLLLVTLFLSSPATCCLGTSLRSGRSPSVHRLRATHHWSVNKWKFILLGDSTVGQEALLRFYVLHVAVLPVVLSLLATIHFWRIRKDGGLSRPAEEDALLPEPAPTQVEIVRGPAVVMATSAAAAAAAEPVLQKRHYGIQGLVRLSSTKVGNVPDRSVFAWPNLFMAELVVFLITVAGVLTVSLFFNAPLEQPVNIMHPPNPAKAPWYRLGLQEQVSWPRARPPAGWRAAG